MSELCFGRDLKVNDLKVGSEVMLDFFFIHDEKKKKTRSSLFFVFKTASPRVYKSLRQNLPAQIVLCAMPVMCCGNRS